MPTDTNWVLDNFDLVQESSGNILTEDGFYIALEEFNTVIWTEDTDTGNG